MPWNVLFFLSFSFWKMSNFKGAICNFWKLKPFLLEKPFWPFGVLRPLSFRQRRRKKKVLYCCHWISTKKEEKSQQNRKPHFQFKRLKKKKEKKFELLFCSSLLEHLTGTTSIFFLATSLNQLVMLLCWSPSFSSSLFFFSFLNLQFFPCSAGTDFWLSRLNSIYFV